MATTVTRHRLITRSDFDEYGGGGHAGTCQIANEDAARVRGELVARINAG